MLTTTLARRLAIVPMVSLTPFGTVAIQPLAAPAPLTMADESCPRPDCDAPITETETAEVGNPRSRDPRTEPVVECANGHKRVP
jgi:hypothetical protein